MAREGALGVVADWNEDRVQEVASEIGNPFVGICMDTVNSLGILETPRQVVAMLGPYVQNLHIRDFTIRRLPSKMGYEVIGCPAGKGKLEID